MSDPRFEFHPITQTSAQIVTLAKVALDDGVRNVTMLADDLSVNAMSSDPAVLILGAWRDGELFGVSGRTWCPDVLGALRMRRFFVAPVARRKGIARTIAKRLLADAGEFCDRVTCNARASNAAPLFWEALGFEPVNEAGITHKLTLRAGE